MGKRRLILSAVAAVLTLAVAFWLAGYWSEPHYQGKSLSDWVVVMRDGPDREKGREVVHMLGPKSLPLLLKWLKQEDRPTMKGRFYHLKEDVENWLMRHRIVEAHSMTGYLDAKESYRALGQSAFSELGRDGRAAIPALIQMLGEKDRKTAGPSVAAGMAFCILPGMVPDSIGPLIQALSNSDWQVRILAAGSLGRIGTNASAAIPVLETWLHDNTLWMRLTACNNLGKLGADPHEFLPVLVQGLHEGDHEALNYDIEILLRFKSEAKPAVPVLLEILSNTPDTSNPTNGWIRGDVINALHEIDPEAAAKAGIKWPP